MKLPLNVQKLISQNYVQRGKTCQTCIARKCVTLEPRQGMVEALTSCYKQLGNVWLTLVLQIAKHTIELGQGGGPLLVQGSHSKRLHIYIPQSSTHKEWKPLLNTARRRHLAHCCRRPAAVTETASMWKVAHAPISGNVLEFVCGLNTSSAPFLNPHPGESFSELRIVIHRFTHRTIKETLRVTVGRINDC